MCTFNEGAHHGCTCMSHGRRFFTKKERTEHLKDYREKLEKEMAGIDEHLKEMKE